MDCVFSLAWSGQILGKAEGFADVFCVPPDKVVDGVSVWEILPPDARGVLMPCVEAAQKTKCGSSKSGKVTQAAGSKTLRVYVVPDLVKSNLYCLASSARSVHSDGSTLSCLPEDEVVEVIAPDSREILWAFAENASDASLTKEGDDLLSFVIDDDKSKVENALLQVTNGAAKMVECHHNRCLNGKNRHCLSYFSILAVGGRKLAVGFTRNLEKQDGIDSAHQRVHDDIVTSLKLLMEKKASSGTVQLKFNGEESKVSSSAGDLQLPEKMKVSAVDYLSLFRADDLPVIKQAKEKARSKPYGEGVEVKGKRRKNFGMASVSTRWISVASVSGEHAGYICIEQDLEHVEEEVKEGADSKGKEEEKESEVKSGNDVSEKRGREGEEKALRVLVADDEPLPRMTIAKTIEQGGVSVSTVVDGYEAFTALLKDKYDAAFLDIQMPHMCGDLVATMARKAGITVPLFAVTKLYNADRFRQEQLLREAGFTDFISKPAPLVTVAELLKKHCQHEWTGKVGRAKKQKKAENE
uniref:Response regulatory domain-containing protein n=1 Tax=Palpitomonas bilix TaxID=652834 RepID=A0A7S3GAE2_9EUKA